MKGIASLVLALLFAGATAVAEAPTLEGAYAFDAAHSDNIDAAIETAVASMNFVLRPFARSRLKKTNPIYQHVTIVRHADEIIVTLDERKPIRMPNDGSTVNWTREDGEKFRVHADWQDAKLSQTFVAEDGQRTNEFTLDSDPASMTLTVTLASERLAKPVTYKMRFRRALAQ